MASLQSFYLSYLGNPTAEALAADASLHYVPTITTLSGAETIIKHLNTQEQLLKGKRNVIHAIENDQNLVIEAETTLQFVNGGGAWLPGMDDNFIVDRTVSIPVVHIVNYNAEGKIQQIRLYWDQASLLKSVEVIGARGKNWPVHLGVDQIRIISKSANSEAAPVDKPVRVGVTNNDKHTSLSLFQNRNIERPESPSKNPVEPRPSAKPAPRDYHELFAAGTTEPLVRPPSPTKENANPIKAGAGKSFNPIRLFDEDDEEVLKSPEKGVKTNPKKYDHFDFGEAEVQPASAAVKKSRHASQWDFADFVTPQKPKARPQYANEQVNFSVGDDEDQTSKPLSFRQPNPHPRPDASAQFEFNDQPTPAVDRIERSIRPASSTTEQGFYHDSTLGQDGADLHDSAATEITSGADGKLPLRNATNTNAANSATQSAHQKHFGSQFELNDEEPADNTKENASLRKPEAATRAQKTMAANWDLYDESPKASGKGIKIAGDGMGSRKTGEKHWWEE